MLEGAGHGSMGLTLGPGVRPEAPSRSLFWQRDAVSPVAARVMGMALERTTLAAATSKLAADAAGRRQKRVVFVNAHVVNSAWRDASYWETVADADMRLADGSGLAIAARLAGTPLPDNVNGTDMLPLLCREATVRGQRIFLLGGVPGAAERTAHTMAAHGGPGTIAGHHHGYFAHDSAEEAEVIARINASGASILLVGFGVPVQDTWIARNAARLDARVLIGVGGLFDFYSGRVSRAPMLLRKLGLEWTWRLAQEPQRMWRRYIIGNVVFLGRAAACAMQARVAGPDRASHADGPQADRITAA